MAAGNAAIHGVAIGDPSLGSGSTASTLAGRAQLKAKSIPGLAVLEPGGRVLDEIVLPAALDHLGAVRDRVAEAARSLGLPDECVDEVRLAVGEAFVNAVQHGCRVPRGAGRAGRQKHIAIKVMENDETLTIEVRDPGEGFRPEQVRPPAMTDLRPCGRGIFFMRLAMDEVSFDFSSGTLVRMIKRIHPFGRACAGS